MEDSIDDEVESVNTKKKVESKKEYPIFNPKTPSLKLV